MSEADMLAREVESLRAKVKAMRELLYEWNCSSGPVWEHRKMMAVGETANDYRSFYEEEDDLPSLFTNMDDE